jgi:hypothetical protein
MHHVHRQVPETTGQRAGHRLSHGGTVRWFRVTYVQSPEVQIRNDLAISQWVDSPHTVFQAFNIAEIEDEVPAIIGT